MGKGGVLFSSGCPLAGGDDAWAESWKMCKSIVRRWGPCTSWEKHIAVKQRGPQGQAVAASCRRVGV